MIKLLLGYLGISFQLIGEFSASSVLNICSRPNSQKHPEYNPVDMGY